MHGALQVDNRSFGVQVASHDGSHDIPAFISRTNHFLRYQRALVDKVIDQCYQLKINN